MSERFAGRYALLKPIGQGGMGEVFLARDLATGAECALKRLTARTGVSAPASMQREFEALTRVRHPAVVAVHELGFTLEGTPYYTMEYVPGVAASEACARGDWAALFYVAARVAAGLEALHAAGVIHGDLKPSNIIVVPGAAPGDLPAGLRLLDFGLSALLGRDASGHRGTPGYAAPELVRGDAPTVASDLYGLGSTLYTLIARRPAFEGDDPGTVLRRQKDGPPAALALEEAGASAALVRLVLQLMARDPTERPRDAREVRRELERMHAAARRPLADRLQAATVVGREREMARLEKPREPGSGSPRVIIVSGEPGIGKSVLLADLAARATLGDSRVIPLACGLLDGPGAVAIALLRRLAADARVEAESATLAPEIGAALRGDPEALQERHLDTLVAAAAGWMAADRTRPILGILDETDRIDAPSRAFARRLALHPDAPPALWVWGRRTQRDGLPEDERTLVQAGLAELLELGPLDAEAVTRLAAVRLGEPAPEALTRFLWERASGHPGLTVELLRSAAAAGAFLEGEGGIEIDAAVLERVRLPRDFEATLLQRLDGLPGPARAAAAALAAWRRPVAPAAIGALAPDADAEAFATLVRSGLASSDAEGRIALTPASLAERVLEGLPDDARGAIHRAALGIAGIGEADRFRHLRALGEAAAALEAAGRALDAFPDEALAVDAAALAESEHPATAATWHARAARLLADRGRFAAAIPHLERALEREPAGAETAERWLMLSAACLRVGRHADVARAVAAGLATNPDPALRSKLLSNESARLAALGDFEASIQKATEAKRFADQSDDMDAVGTATMTLAGSLLAIGKAVDAESAANHGIEAYTIAGSVGGRIRAMGNVAMAAQVMQQRDRAEKIHIEALKLARGEGLRPALQEELASLGGLLLELGRWNDARDAYAEALRLALEDGRPRGAAFAQASLVQVGGLTGNSAAALRGAAAAIRSSRASLPRAEAFAWRSAAQAYRITGRLRLAERAARRAIALAMRGAPLGEQDWCRIEYCRCAIAAGRWTTAGTLAKRALEHRDAGSLTSTVLASIAGRAALRSGDLPASIDHLRRAETWLADHPAPYASALVAQLKAGVLLTERKTSDAVEHATRALEAFAALPAPPDRAIAALELARIAIGLKGDVRAPVGEWLDQAAGIFERLGDRRGRERSLELLVRWLRRSSARDPFASRDRNLIHAVSRLLNSMSDLRQLTQQAMVLAVEQLAAERGVLLLIDPETGQLAPMAEHGAMDSDARRDAVGYSRRVVRSVTEEGGSLVISDAPSDPGSFSKSMEDMRLRSIVCVPMFASGRVIGAVYLDDSRPDIFSEADRGLLEGFAQLMAVAIENSREQEEVLRANEQLAGENLSLRLELNTKFQPHNLIGTSTAMQRVLALAERAAQAKDTTVLLTGENGTGKELIARVLHFSGKRMDGPFVAVNCGAIPETLLEAELFGHEQGAFTGADRTRIGKFELANGGTLFLDEIGEMPPKQQVALLRFLQDHVVERVGGSKPIPVDVRIVAATNRDLARLIQENRFREDLYYRLNVFRIEVPPLRDRKADIPALAHYFVAQFAQKQERDVPELSAGFTAALMQSDWPGNVRELQNYIERLMAMTTGRVLHPIPPPSDLEGRGGMRRVHGRGLSETVAHLEKKLLADALDRAQGNQSLAARELGLKEATLRYRLRKFGIVYRENLRTRNNPRRHGK